jgi:hypothetical protein
MIRKKYNDGKKIKRANHLKAANNMLWIETTQ